MFGDSRRTLEVRVLDVDTLEPVAGSEVRADYPPYPFFSFTASKPTKAITNEMGLAKLQMNAHWIVNVSAEQPGRLTPVVRMEQQNVEELTKGSDGTPQLTILAQKSGTDRPVIELVIPDGYRGPVKVRIESEDTPAHGQRRFTFVARKDGHVIVRGPRFLDHWKPDFGAKYEAKYANGAPIPKAGSDNQLIALRYVASGPHSYLYAIGTDSDVRMIEGVHIRNAPNEITHVPAKYERYMAE